MYLTQLSLRHGGSVLFHCVITAELSFAADKLHKQAALCKHLQCTGGQYHTRYIENTKSKKAVVLD